MNWTPEQLAERNARIFGALPCGHPPTPEGKCGIPWCGTPDMSAEKPPDVPEELIEAECTNILERDGWRALRTDPVSDRGRGKGFGEIGMADHLYIRYKQGGHGGIGNQDFPQAFASCQLMWIEFKRPGEKAKKHQTAWHIRERARGALTLIAGEDFPASVEGFRKWYDGSGLRRN